MNSHYKIFITRYGNSIIIDIEHSTMVTNASIDCDLSTSIDMVTSFQYIIPFNCNSVPITSILPQEETSKRKKSESLVNLFTRGIQCFVDCKKATECINTNVYNPQKTLLCWVTFIQNRKYSKCLY